MTSLRQIIDDVFATDHWWCLCDRSLTTPLRDIISTSSILSLRHRSSLARAPQIFMTSSFLLFYDSLRCRTSILPPHTQSLIYATFTRNFFPRLFFGFFLFSIDLSSVSLVKKISSGMYIQLFKDEKLLLFISSLPVPFNYHNSIPPIQCLHVYIAST